MKKLFLLLRAQYRSLLLFCASGVSAMALFCTIDISQQWLIYTTHVPASINYMQLFFVAVWYIFGGASVCIPLALFCFGFARWHSIKMGCEQLFFALFWCISSAFIIALYHVDYFIPASGGIIGAYGARLVCAVIGMFAARVCGWFLWMITTFLVSYELFLYSASQLYHLYAMSMRWYHRYRIEPQDRSQSVDHDNREPLPSGTTDTDNYSRYDTFFGEATAAPSVEIIKESPTGSYLLPQLNIFVPHKDSAASEKLTRELNDKAQLLAEKLERFGVSGTVVDIKRGPVVTLYEYQPHMDTKISKIIALEDDLALALQALSIRIIAPIPGRSVVGFEVANTERQAVTMASLVHTDTFLKTTAQLPFLVGVDTTGESFVVDLARMPHLLIAGSTGSGKSVALNTLLMSLLCSRTPDACRLILIDPKRIEFAAYADIPHLLFPIVTDARTASLVLKWVVKHMEERYTLLAAHGVRSSKEFNQRVERGIITVPLMPSLIIMIDELADLMMTAGRDVEDAIARIAQMARAAGIHLVVATQRPSVDVITGLIKVNFPSRMAFRVASRIDSRTILDTSGADKLLGRGDMLFLDGSSAQVRRLHGAYVSDDEIYALIAQVKRAGPPQYKNLQEELATLPADTPAVHDGLYNDVIAYLKEIDEISISLLQRKFRIGYNRSARLIDLLEQQGLIMPPDGVKPRKVIR